MKDSQMHFVKKMFERNFTRTVWNNEEEKHYIRVIDSVILRERRGDL